MQDDSIPEEQVHLSNDEDSENDHQPKADLRKNWWKPLPKEERPATPEPAWTIPSSNKSYVIGDMTTFMNWYCQKVNKTVLTQADFKGQAYEVVKAFYPDAIHLQFQMEEYHTMLTTQVDWTNLEGDHVRIDVNRPLPLGGPLGHVTIQPQFFFNTDLEYLRYVSKGSNPALSISKMKAASYPDFELELLVPEQIWIDDVCIYDISAKYSISHWWFNRQKFYIDRHDSLSCRKDVRTHMRILSVVRIKAYSRYGDFEDLNLLLLQGHLDHLPGSDKQMLSTTVKQFTRNLVIRQRVEDFQLGIESYQTQLNLTKTGWDATGYEFKHDYTIIESPRAVVFPWIFNSLVRSLRALSTLRRSGLRTANATAKPCQGDSLEFYLITGKNEAQVVQSDASSVPNDAVMMITNDIYEQDVQCVTSNQPNKTVNASLTAELARYKELPEVYEKGPNLN
ncbi:hypothetical protein Tco_0770693 [Tanacetum coccineum]|uniref:Uncharacterized protein n=1 Tax=Tanacetum coccineum TaxID=301880 RepID=A0ABQ4ZFV0_9ASTR